MNQENAPEIMRGSMGSLFLLHFLLESTKLYYSTHIAYFSIPQIFITRVEEPEAKSVPSDEIANA